LAPKELVDQMNEADEKQQRNIHDLVERPSDANLHKLELIMDFIVDFLWDKMRSWCHVDKDDEEGMRKIKYLYSLSRWQIV
jgi:hypothetical protein